MCNYVSACAGTLATVLTEIDILLRKSEVLGYTVPFPWNV